MGAAYFYHLTQRPMDATLPILLEKARGAGWRIVVRGTDQGRMMWLDEKLWSQGPESFLAHGVAGGPHDALQPILLTTDVAVPNEAGCIMSVDGAVVSPQEVKDAERVCILFDAHDMEAVAYARTQWKTLTDAGCAAQYWSEESGNWQKKAEKEEG
ncbi:MAG: DNA polymerase III subunit chi [Shimia sp.]|nr:DNA polymerase III subunit chi [Shimia sp.]